MKVYLVVTEQRDENGNVCNYGIIGVYDTYILAKKKQRMWIHYWEKADRKIFFIGKDTAASISKYDVRSIIYVEGREVK